MMKYFYFQSFGLNGELLLGDPFQNILLAGLVINGNYFTPFINKFIFLIKIYINICNFFIFL